MWRLLLYLVVVRWLSFKSLNIGSSGIKVLCPHIGKMHIQVLVFERCGLCDDSCPHLSQIIKVWNPTNGLYPLTVCVRCQWWLEKIKWRERHNNQLHMQNHSFKVYRTKFHWKQFGIYFRKFFVFLCLFRAKRLFWILCSGTQLCDQIIQRSHLVSVQKKKKRVT